MDFLHDIAVFLLRWLHVVAAIAWIGESFYFVMLDRSLQAPQAARPGLVGESWSVHGGGFYLKQKFMPAPAELPDTLHWSKWKAYTTWLSGFVLLALLYFMSPSVYLVDPAVAALTPAEAVAGAIGLLVVGWLGYDLLCRLLGFRERLLGVAIALGVLALSYAASQLFAGRAAFLLVGAVLGTIMAGNVWLVIIPGQKRLVAALQRGQAPDPLPGLRGRQRSVHNTYLTLPVVFAMLSVHFPTAYSHPYNWAVLALFMAAAALIRQFFVLWHGGARAWGMLAAAGVLLVAALAWLAPREAAAPTAPVDAAEPPLAPELQAATPSDAAIQALLLQRCGDCHRTQPRLLPSAASGIRFDEPGALAGHARAIHQQTVVLRLMPPGNMTQMSDAERDALDRWFRGAAAPPPE